MKLTSFSTLNFLAPSRVSGPCVFILVVLIAGNLLTINFIVDSWRAQRQLRLQIRTHQSAAQEQGRLDSYIAPERLNASHAIIETLNTPWLELLRGIERSKPSTVSLIELAAQTGERKVTLLAEAADAEVLFDFLDAMSVMPPYKISTPLHYEIVEVEQGVDRQLLPQRVRMRIALEWES